MRFNSYVRFGITMLVVMASFCVRQHVVQAQTTQSSTPHMLHAGNLVPGEIGAQALMRKAPLAGYFQPIEIRMPLGMQIGVAIENEFSEPIVGNPKVGLLIGQVYRFKVTNIPRNVGAEVYPTIELINRTYPPAGQEFQFPIPVELTQEDIEHALNGRFVTRVIYVENPDAALPFASKDQPLFEARPGEDPLTVADRLGRPVAILRMGGRLPDPTLGPDAHFMYNSPAMLLTTEVSQQVYPDPASKSVAANRARTATKATHLVGTFKTNDTQVRQADGYIAPVPFTQQTTLPASYSVQTTANGVPYVTGGMMNNMPVNNAAANIPAANAPQNLPAKKPIIINGQNRNATPSTTNVPVQNAPYANILNKR